MRKSALSIRMVIHGFMPINVQHLFCPVVFLRLLSALTSFSVCKPVSRLIEFLRDAAMLDAAPGSRVYVNQLEDRLVGSVQVC